MLGGPVEVLVIAADPAPLAAQVALAGVDVVLAVAAGGAEVDADTHAAVVGELAARRGAEAVLVAHTATSLGWAAAVAAAHGLGFASDVLGLARSAEGGIVATRPFYGGKLLGDVDFPGRKRAVLAIRAGVFAAAEAATAGAVEQVAAAGGGRVEHRAYVPAPTGDVDITQAAAIIAVGRGIGDRDELPRVEALAERLGATLAVSRPIVDAGWMPAARQVGQSGRTVAPAVYVALGISGAVQHLAGMRGAGTILAVNTDPEAAIFGVAHLGSSCDLHDVLDELEELVP